MTCEIIQVQSGEKLEQIRSLFREYAAELDFDLSFQHFEEELDRLPGEYAEPTGGLLLAVHAGQAVGCVGLREIEEGIGEMKRLYVQEPFRNLGIGKLLAEAIIQEAVRIGYRRMRLDTVPSMAPARRLYSALGFQEVGAYRYNPIEGAIYMELILR